MSKKLEVELYVVVDKYGRIYWTSAKKEYIPTDILSKEGYNLVLLKGEVDVK